MRLDVKIHDDRIGTVWPYPSYATDGSVGLDLRSCVDHTLQPNETLLVSTGISCAISDPSYAMLVLPRSSLGHKHKVMMSNSIGLIDYDYRGIIYVSLWNRGLEAYELEAGDRIAQAFFVAILKPMIKIVDELPETDRGSGGFGSTGKV